MDGSYFIIFNIYKGLRGDIMSELDDDELRATRKRNGVEPVIKSKLTEEEINKLIERTGIKIDRIYFSEE